MSSTILSLFLSSIIITVLKAQPVNRFSLMQYLFDFTEVSQWRCCMQRVSITCLNQPTLPLPPPQQNSLSIQSSSLVRLSNSILTKLTLQPGLLYYKCNAVPPSNSNQIRLLDNYQWKPQNEISIKSLEFVDFQYIKVSYLIYVY